MALTGFDKLNLEFIEELNLVVFPAFIDGRYRAQVWDTTVELVMVEDDKRVFGSGIDLSNRKKYGSKERSFEINYGTCGSHDITDSSAVSKVQMIYQIYSNWAAVRALVTKYNLQFEEMMKK